jgi:hypothetical protein
MDCFVATLLAMTVFRLFKYRSWLRVIASLAAMSGAAPENPGCINAGLLSPENCAKLSPRRKALVLATIEISYRTFDVTASRLQRVIAFQ